MAIRWLRQVRGSPRLRDRSRGVHARLTSTLAEVLAPAAVAVLPGPARGPSEGGSRDLGYGCDRHGRPPGRGAAERSRGAGAWLYRIATNRCLNALRSASRRPATNRRKPTDIKRLWLGPMSQPPPEAVVL